MLTICGQNRCLVIGLDQGDIALSLFCRHSVRVACNGLERLNQEQAGIRIDWNRDQCLDAGDIIPRQRRQVLSDRALRPRGLFKPENTQRQRRQYDAGEDAGPGFLHHQIAYRALNNCDFSTSIPIISGVD